MPNTQVRAYFSISSCNRFIAVLLLAIAGGPASFAQTKSNAYSMSPVQGMAGSLVTITGSGFGDPCHDCVTFGGIAATVEPKVKDKPELDWTNSKIVVRVPDGIGTGGVEVMVKVPKRTVDLGFFYLVQAGPPDPAQGPPGTQVTIPGKGFGTRKESGDSVKFDGIDASSIIEWSDEEILAVSPNLQPGVPVKVTVTHAGKTIDAGIFTGTPVAGQSKIPGGASLNGTTNVKDNVRVVAVLLPLDAAKKVFGTEIAKRYAVVQVSIDNQSSEASFVLQDVALDYSGWLLSGLGKDSANCERSKELTSFQAETCSKQLESVESRVVRGELQNAADGTARNWFIRSTVLIGAIATGLPQFKSAIATKTIGVFTGEAIPGLQILWPDPTVAQVNRVSDLAFQSNKLFPKQTADIFYAFFPIDRFLTPGLRDLFLNAPALFFSPAEMFFDPQLKDTNDEDGKAIPQGHCFSSSAACKRQSLRSNVGKVKEVLFDFSGQHNDKQMIDALMHDGSNGAKEVLAGVSLDNIKLIASGIMSADTSTVPASLQEVTMDGGDHSDKVWRTTCSALPGTIAGKFLTDGTPAISRIELPPNYKGGLTDYLDDATLKAVADGSSDTKLKFTMQLKSILPSGSKLYFIVTKNSSASKGPAVKSMEYEYEVTYTLAKGETAPSTTPSSKSCKEQSTTADEPTFDPTQEDFKAGDKVTIATKAKDATIYYTTNDTKPTDKSTKYSEPVEIKATTTIQAIAVAKGLTDSDIATGKFEVTTEGTATVSFPLKSGTYKAGTKVTIDATPKTAVIHYTLKKDETPTEKSPTYEAKTAIVIQGDLVVNAIAIAEGLANSAVVTATYKAGTLVGTPTFTPNGGTFATEQSVTISDATKNSTIFYSTDPKIPTSKWAKYTAPVKVVPGQTIQAFATASGLLQSAVAKATFHKPTEKPK